jgi:hypothetical protein
MVSCCGCVAMAVALRLGRWEGRTRQGWEGRRKETELCFRCACAETVAAVTATCIGFRFRFILFASLLQGAAGTAGMGTLPPGRWGSVCLGCPGSQSSIGPSSRPIGTCVHRFRDHVSLGSRCVVSSCVKSVFIDHVLDHVQC